MAKQLRFSVCAAAFVLAVSSLAGAAQNADVAGEWTLTMSLPNGNTRTAELTLEQDGTELKGTWLGEGQEEPTEITGTVEGNNVTIVTQGFPGRGGRGGGGGGGGRGGGGRGGGGPLEWKGTVDGDKLSGTMEAGGGRFTIEWSAERAE